MNPVKAVLFDLDDTLFDHLHAARSSLAALRKDLPRFAEAPLDVLEAEYAERLEEVHLRVLSGEIDLDDARRERMRALMSGGDTDPTDDAVDEMAVRFREGYQTNRRVVEGAKELLSELRERGLTIGLVTNNKTGEQLGKLAFTGLDGYVDFMITSEEVGPPKPEPLIFHVALERAGCTADEAVVVGDSWASDITGAENAGIRAVWYNPRRLSKPKITSSEESFVVEEIHSLTPSRSVAEAIIGSGRNRA